MPNGWSGTATAFDASFARLCAGAVPPLVASLGPGPGRSLLDVGCGSGNVVAAARSAGFTAVGTDAESSMVRLAAQQHPDVSFVQGALPRLPFACSAFDAAAANFVVNHTADPRVSIRELARMLVPGGRLALTLWTAGVSPLNQLWDDVLAAASVAPMPARSLPPDKDFERSPAGLAAIVGGAGLEDVEVSEVSWLFQISAEDLWRGVEGGVATIGLTYRAQSLAAQRRMRAAYLRLTHEQHPDGDLPFPSSALLACGRSPD